MQAFATLDDKDITKNDIVLVFVPSHLVSFFQPTGYKYNKENRTIRRSLITNRVITHSHFLRSSTFLIHIFPHASFSHPFRNNMVSTSTAVTTSFSLDLLPPYSSWFSIPWIICSCLHSFFSSFQSSAKYIRSYKFEMHLHVLHLSPSIFRYLTQIIPCLIPHCSLYHSFSLLSLPLSLPLFSFLSLTLSLTFTFSLSHTLPHFHSRSFSLSLHSLSICLLLSFPSPLSLSYGILFRFLFSFAQRKC